MRFIAGDIVYWNGDSELQRYFEDFLRANTYPRDFDEMPRKWQQAQTVLSGVALRLQLRGAIGAASMAEWK